MLDRGHEERLSSLFRASSPIRWQRVTRGYTPVERWIVSLSDGRSLFLKIATVPWTAQALRAEYRVYSQLHAGFLPRMLWWDDDGEKPILALEDLSNAIWPPPWTPDRIEGVLDMLAAVHAARIADVPTLPDIDARENWQKVGAEPGPFLSFGLCTSHWLNQELPKLVAAEASAPLEGDDLLHVDVRSDNICFVEGRALLIDWNLACYGNGDFDVAAWLPSLEAEGGPPPESLLPHAPELAAHLSGYFASHAGLVVLPDDSDRRNIQLDQLKTALPWAIRALGLPPLDGHL